MPRSYIAVLKPEEFLESEAFTSRTEPAKAIAKEESQ